MEPKDKHNIFSKEEFFKSIDEKRSLPPEADDFDKEAMEGLAMVKDRKKLDTLNEAIDEVLRREAAKAGRKRNMYYFAAAASLVLVVSFFFLLKDSAVMKEDKNLAQSKPETTEQVVITEKEPASSGEVATKASEPPAEKMVATGSVAEGKETPMQAKPMEEPAKGETFAADIAVKTPEADLANNITLAENEKANDNAGAGIDATLEDKKAGAKSQLDDAEEQKKDRKLSKKADENKVYKEKEADEKDKVRYETNTVWTSPGAVSDKQQTADELKQKGKTEAKPKVSTGDSKNEPVTVTSTNAVTTQSQEETVVLSGKDEDQSKANAPQKNAEVVTVQKQKQSTFGNKRRAKKANRSRSAAFDASGPDEKRDDRAGYAYYTQSSTREFSSPEYMGGDPALEKFVKDNLVISSPDSKGTIVAEFTVKTDGTIDPASVKIQTPIKNCEACGKDVINLIKKMPKWQPATENGEPKEYKQKLSVLYDGSMSKK